ncbi:MAG: InlB B-repeat-containing protein [Prevotella sp.]|nr:InlB B-repeat-containing protein [Prevotella sp.]
MKRVITCLSLLLWWLCGAVAQDISQYEYWTDDDYASRSVVNSSGGDISMQVSTEQLSAGVHYFNFRACRSDGVWGNFYRYLYYIPTLSAEADGSVNVEYWLDDDLAGVKTQAASGGSMSLSLDISSLSPGVHYFNCTPVTVTGERGNTERYIFYVPLTFEQNATSPLKGYEYWLDDDYSGKKTGTSNVSNPMLTIDISSLKSGVHYFNFRAYNERGEYGNPVREMFYIPQANPNINATLSKAVYWLDDDYASKVTVETSNTEQAYTIDISHLGPGVHYFNYRAFDNEGNPGSWIREIFYLAHGEQTSTSDKIDYEYWIDDNTADKVTGSGTGSEYMFTIDVAGLAPGKHTFNFRAKNVLDQWGDVFIEEFEITDGSLAGSYKLTYMVDGVEYKSSTVEYGTTITPETPPTKEGYTFSGWSEIPSTMPASDVTITGTFTVNKYKLTYKVDGEEYNSSEVNYGTTIVPLETPVKEGYTFSGWSNIPTTMPASDVTISGTFTINKYKITYMVDGVLLMTEEVNYGSTITPPASPKEGYEITWNSYPTTMPADDITISGSYIATGINGLYAEESDKKIYTPDGKRIQSPKKGMNIIRMSDGTIKKVVVK